MHRLSADVSEFRLSYLGSQSSRSKFPAFASTTVAQLQLSSTSSLLSQKEAAAFLKKSSIAFLKNALPIENIEDATVDSEI